MPQGLSNRKGAVQTRIEGRKLSAFLSAIAGLALFFGQAAFSQTISPLIVEYTGKAGGRIDLTNNSGGPMAIVLEPKSFNIGLDGNATYRPLDPGIHLQLSSMSFRLEPQQTHYVFYKVDADTLPAWFTVYAVFSPIDKAEGLKFRMMLPHTVYLFQKKPLEKESIQILKATYFTGRKTIVFDLQNTSQSLVRVQEVRALGGKDPVLSGGFPLLPGNTRHVEIAWTETAPPTSLLVHFPRFDVREVLNISDQ